MSHDYADPGRDIRPGDVADDMTLDLLPPASLDVPLWRSLWQNLHDRLFPEPLPRPDVTSRPVDVGMMISDIIALPWYRTIFTNLGDVIAPETLPPLELTSQPVDVGELLSDRLQQGWWSSLLRNLADAVAPERLPPLYVTAAPLKPQMASTLLMAPRWSELAPGPRVFFYECAAATPAPSPVPAVPAPSGLRPPLKAEEEDEAAKLIRAARRALRRAHVREVVWVALAVSEVGLLALWQFLPR